MMLSIARFNTSSRQALTEADIEDLNDDLDSLSDTFPDVQPEVFRELLQHVSRKSRRHIIADKLLRDKHDLVNGRYRNTDTVQLSPSERFRTAEYKQTVSDLLHAEFSTLSKSSIKAVLAEHNHCYTQSRPALQALSNKSWRVFLTSIFSRKRDKQSSTRQHPLITWHVHSHGDLEEQLPELLLTRSSELNAELRRTLVEPAHSKFVADGLAHDKALAIQLNELEAEAAEALYDCECCYSPATFEELAVCTDQGHYICFSCVRRTVHEALFGQGWDGSVDTAKATLRCIAPSSPACKHSIASTTVERALLGDSDKDGKALWWQFQDRVVTEQLQRSGLDLLRCPFCTYAEVDTSMKHFEVKTFIAFLATSAKRLRHLFFVEASSIWVDLRIFVILLTVMFSPVIYLALLLAVSHIHIASASTRKTFRNVLHRKHGLRFTCQSPSCGKKSCLGCKQPWLDPHTCSPTPLKPTLDSLRHEIESATTRAIKRTCPNCDLSFVKSSGCNKFTCSTCGYTMCYVCREQITKSQGYNHFCTHFRPDPRKRKCTECDRCDLYAVEDEEETIRRAAVQAEREWLRKAKEDGQLVGVSSKEVGDVSKGVLGKDKGGGVWADTMTMFTNGLVFTFDTFLAG